MSTRRIILLVLLLIPSGFMIVLMSRPASLGDKHNGLEILALILSIPILVLNAWEWQSPDTLDELFPKRKPKTFSTAPQVTPSQKKSTMLIAIGLILGIVLIGCNFIAFSFIGRVVGLLFASTPAYDIPAIQTAAVQTALARVGTIEPAGIATLSPGIETTELTTLTPGAESTDMVILTEMPTPAEATPSAQSIGSLGERIEYDGVAVTVTNISMIDSINGSTTTQAGYLFLIVEVVIENASRPEELPYDPLYFDVTDSNGIQYAPAFIAPDPALSSGNLETGSQVSGNVAFEVDATAFGFIVTYLPVTTTGGLTPIRIDLGQ